MCTRSCKVSSPDLVCPLQEVAGAEGVVRVPAPFLLQDLSQVKQLGSYSANPGNYTKEFQYLAQAYDLTWHDLHVVQTTTLTLEERERIQAAAREHADRVHKADAALRLVLRQFPPWIPDGIIRLARRATSTVTAWSLSHCWRVGSLSQGREL